MDKRSNEHIPCAYCDEDALPGTEPPVCERHRDEAQRKKASEDDAPETLKELADKRG